MSFAIEVSRVDRDHSPRHPAGLGIPAYVIADFKSLSHLLDSTFIRDGTVTVCGAACSMRANSQVRWRSLRLDVNGFWTNKSFRNYADYTLTEKFQAGLEDLLDEGRKRRCAIMCSEAVWWRCHRRIVADYLVANGLTVFHIMGGDRLEPARLTSAAVVQPCGTIVYPVAD